MKKKLLIGLGVFYSLVIVAVVAVTMHFWSYISAVDWKIVNSSNIRALYQGLTEPPEVTSEKKKQIDSQRSEEIRNYVNMDLREYTEEEKLQIENGEKSETEILAQIITETVEKNGQDTAENQEDKPDSDVTKTDEKKTDNSAEVKPKTQTETAEQIVARHVSELYAIQKDFEGRVSALASSASNWVKAYKKVHPDQTWRDAKIAGVQHFSGTATQIESECYALVDAQVEKLKADLAAIGADTSIASTVQSTAYAEMEARKTQIVQEGYAKMNK